MSTDGCPSDLTSAYASWYNAYFSDAPILSSRTRAFYNTLSADLSGTTSVSSATVTMVMDETTPSFSASIRLVLYDEVFDMSMPTVSGTDVQTAIVNAVVSEAATLLVGMFPLLGTYGFS